MNSLDETHLTNQVFSGTQYPFIKGIETRVTRQQHGAKVVSIARTCFARVTPDIKNIFFLGIFEVSYAISFFLTMYFVLPRYIPPVP
jgi:hypothetical protein